MAQVAYITTAGQAAIASATVGGYKIDLVRYKIGDTLITETNVTTIRNYTTLPGTTVYDSGNNPTDSSLRYQLSSSGILITVYLNSDIGSFTMGTVGLYLSDGTLFAILKLPETYSKTTNVGAVAGNVIAFPFVFALTVQSVLNIDVLPESVASLPTVATETDLPSYSVAPYSNYFVQDLAETGQPAIAYQTSTGWQYTLASKSAAFEGWLGVASSDFSDTALEGDVVYLDASTAKWSGLDGGGDEVKVFGVRNGNGVRLSSFYYKANAFIANTDYYVDTYPNLGKLTTLETKQYLGTALTSSLLFIKSQYTNTEFDSSVAEFYEAFVDSSNIIRLTLEDTDRYPTEYTNALRVSFVSPITTIAGQKVGIGSLDSVYIKRRSDPTLTSAEAVAAGDILAGELVNLTYLGMDEGFRLEKAVRKVGAAKINYQVSSGSAGGGSTASAWTTRPLNVIAFDTNSITSLASNQFTLAAGTYKISANMTMTYSGTSPAAAAASRIRNITDSSTPSGGVGVNCSVAEVGAAGISVVLTITPFIVTISSSKVFELQYYSPVAQVTSGLGEANSNGTEVEVYASVNIEKL